MTYHSFIGNLILGLLMCLIIFFVFMALHPTPVHGQAFIGGSYGDGFPHPRPPVSAQRAKCLTAALARYGKSTTALDAAARACARYR
jgi:hypothetical protein